MHTNGAEENLRVRGVDHEGENFAILPNARIDATRRIVHAGVCPGPGEYVVRSHAEGHSDNVSLCDVLERVGLKGQVGSRLGIVGCLSEYHAGGQKGTSGEGSGVHLEEMSCGYFAAALLQLMRGFQPGFQTSYIVSPPPLRSAGSIDSLRIVSKKSIMTLPKYNAQNMPAESKRWPWFQSIRSD